MQSVCSDPRLQGAPSFTASARLFLEVGVCLFREADAAPLWHHFPRSPSQWKKELYTYFHVSSAAGPSLTRGSALSHVVTVDNRDFQSCPQAPRPWALLPWASWLLHMPVLSLASPLFCRRLWGALEMFQVLRLRCGCSLPPLRAARRDPGGSGGSLACVLTENAGSRASSRESQAIGMCQRSSRTMSSK